MWIEVVTVFLGLSLLFYCLFAGADFGAGILEAFMGRTNRAAQREVIGRAMGPVWEANHVWLILAVVILFVGFPKAYSELSVSFHIPLTLMLIGIVLRGCAFTFRHYDAVHDRSQRYYSGIFVVSSLLTPFMLGLIAGGLLLGRVTPVQRSFQDTYIRPWANLFCASIGLFTCVLFALLASVYLVGETSEAHLKQIFRKRAGVCNLSTLLSGVLVFAAAEIDGFSLTRIFAHHSLSVACMALAVLLAQPLWRALRADQAQQARVFVAAQVALVLLGWYNLQFPTLIRSSTGVLTIYNTAAPQATLRFLVYALIAGSIVIFPSLYYLLRIFKVRPSQ